MGACVIPYYDAYFYCLEMSSTEPLTMTSQVWFTHAQVLGYATGTTKDATERKIRTALETRLCEDR